MDDEMMFLEVLGNIAEALDGIKKTLEDIRDDLEGDRNGVEISLNGPISVQTEDDDTLTCYCIQDS